MRRSNLGQQRSSAELINAAFWGGGDHVAEYSGRVLNPAEATILFRYRKPLSGRVLEVGCGAGRILGYLMELGGEVHAFDVSEAMVEYCRRTYPRAQLRVGDLRTVRDDSSGRFDVVIAADNVIDVLDHEARGRVLADLRQVVADGGLLIFSSHNFAYSPTGAGGASSRTVRIGQLLDRNLSSMLRAAPRVLERARNRRRLAPMQYRAADHALLNDSAHDYSLLHYYIGRDDQARQLQALGFELTDCLDLNGAPVGPAQAGDTTSLYYVARAIG